MLRTSELFVASSHTFLLKFDHTSFLRTWEMELWKRFILCPVQPMRDSLPTLFLSMFTRFVLATHKRTHSVAALNRRLYSPTVVKSINTQTRQFGSSPRKPTKPDDVIRGRRIEATRMIVIDVDGSNLGVMNKKSALRLAEEKHLELVQVRSIHLAQHIVTLHLFRCVRQRRKLCVV